MNGYMRNRRCLCLRCRTRGLMGATILVTLGVLFLLDNFDLLDFDRSSPILLIVIGLCILAGRTASTQGHIQPFAPAGNPVAELPASQASHDPQVKS